MTDADELSAVRRRLPVGSRVRGRVGKSPVGVGTGNREYTARFEDCWVAVEYDGPPPAVGAVVSLVVVDLLEWTHQILVRPAS